MDSTALSNGIQLAIAPVFLLTAIAGLIGALATRLGRIIDRARQLEEKLGPWHPDRDTGGAVSQLPADEAYSRFSRQNRHMAQELTSLASRARMINFSMTLLVMCAILIGVTILELFLSELGTGRVAQISRWVPISFISGLGCFIAALICFLREVLLATQSVRIGVRRH